MVKLNYKIINDLQGGEKTIFKPSFSGLDKGVKHNVHKHQSSHLENKHLAITKATEKIEKQLDNLLDMRINDEIGLDKYNEKKHELESNLKDYKNRAEMKSGQRADWRIKVEDALDFAMACAERFKNGDRETRHFILNKLSSNLFYTTEKKVNFNLKKEYQIMADEDKWEEQYSNRLEPQYCTELLTKNPSLRPINPVMLRQTYKLRNWILENIESWKRTWDMSLQPTFDFASLA